MRKRVRQPVVRAIITTVCDERGPFAIGDGPIGKLEGFKPALVPRSLAIESKPLAVMADLADTPLQVEHVRVDGQVPGGVRAR